MPRSAIPDSVIPDFVKQKLKYWRFMSNPCRMTIFSQEIVIFRADLMSKLMRHAIQEPKGKMPELTVKTILSQAHLAPFPSRLSPIYWGWDHALTWFEICENILYITKKAILVSIFSISNINPVIDKYYS